MPDETSINVRKAIQGDSASTEWLVHRFHGVLRAHARYRLSLGAAPRLTEEDLVQEVWARSLPRLGDIQERDGRATPVMLRFLGRMLVNVCFEEQRRARRHPTSHGEDLDRPPSEVTGISTLAHRQEETQIVLSAIEALEEKDRSVLLLRLVEGVPNNLAAQAVGLSPSATSRRYDAALDRLRRELPTSLFEDLSPA